MLKSQNPEREGPITHEHIREDIMTLRTMVLWVIMLGVLLAGGLGSTLVYQSMTLAKTVTTQTELQKKVKDNQEDAVAQRNLFANTMQNINDRLFDLWKAMQAGDVAAKEHQSEQLDKHLDREHRGS